MIEVAKWFGLPLVLIIFSLLGLKRIKMTSREEFSFVWFIINGAIIHIFMDGLAGTLGFC